jgi:hypothetical protein
MPCAHTALKNASVPRPARPSALPCTAGGGASEGAAEAEESIEEEESSSGVVTIAGHSATTRTLSAAPGTVWSSCICACVRLHRWVEVAAKVTDCKHSAVAAAAAAVRATADSRPPRRQLTLSSPSAIPRAASLLVPYGPVPPNDTAAVGGAVGGAVGVWECAQRKGRR